MVFKENAIDHLLCWGDSDHCCFLPGMSALLEKRPAEECESVMDLPMHCCT